MPLLNPKQPPTQAALGKLISDMAKMGVNVKPADVAGKTRAEIAAHVKSLLV